MITIYVLAAGGRGEVVLRPSQRRRQKAGGGLLALVPAMIAVNMTAAGSSGEVGLRRSRVVRGLAPV